MTVEITSNRRYSDGIRPIWDILKDGHFIIGFDSQEKAIAGLAELEGNNWTHLVCYCIGGIRCPLQWIDYVRSKCWTFERTLLEESSNGKIFFAGNIVEYSAAFRFLILDADLASSVRERAPEVPYLKAGQQWEEGDAASRYSLPKLTLRQAARRLKSLVEGMPGPKDHLRLAEACLQTETLDQALQSLAGKIEHQVDIDSAAHYIRNAMAGGLPVTPAEAIALASEALADARATLPGVWNECDPGLFVKEFNDHQAWIEARIDGNVIRFDAKYNGIVGGFMKAVQLCGHAQAPIGVSSEISRAITQLECRLEDILQQAS